MIALRPNCVASFKMNDNAANPWITGLSGAPTELVDGGAFSVGDDGYWTWGTPWVFATIPGQAKFSGAVPAYLEQDIGIIQGQKYLVIFAIDANEGPVQTITPYVGGQAGTGVTSLEQHAEVVTAADSSGVLKFLGSGSGGANVRLDDVYCICLNDFPCTGVYKDETYCYTSDHSVAGKVNTALNLDGTNDRIEVSDGGALSFNSGSQDFSIAILIKRAGAYAEKCLLDKRDGNNDGWSLRLASPPPFNAALPKFYLNAIAMTSDTGITDTNWHLIKVVVNRGGTAYMYLDNVQVASVAISGEVMNITNNLFIGQTYNDIRKFEGDIDVISFFDKALSAAERTWLWNSGDCTERLNQIAYYDSVNRGVMVGVMRGTR